MSTKPTLASRSWCFPDEWNSIFKARKASWTFSIIRLGAYWGVRVPSSLAYDHMMSLIWIQPPGLSVLMREWCKWVVSLSVQALLYMESKGRGVAAWMWTGLPSGANIPVCFLHQVGASFELRHPCPEYAQSPNSPVVLSSLVQHRRFQTGGSGEPSWAGWAIDQRRAQQRPGDYRPLNNDESKVRRAGQG